MPKLFKSISTDETSRRAAMLWKKELERENPSMWRVVFRMDRGTYWLSVVLVLIQGALLSVGRPLMLQIVQSSLTNTEEGRSNSISAPAIVTFLTLLVIAEAFCSTLG